jgi:hypothetical protein
MTRGTCARCRQFWATDRQRPAGKCLRARSVETAGPSRPRLYRGSRKSAICRYFQAAEGTRTLDLLHGKQTLIVRSYHFIPAYRGHRRLRHVGVCLGFSRVSFGFWHSIGTETYCETPVCSERVAEWITRRPPSPRRVRASSSVNRNRMVHHDQEANSAWTAWPALPPPTAQD